MEPGLVIVIALVSIAIGLAIGWLAARSRSAHASLGAHADLTARAAAAEAEAQILAAQLDEHRTIQRELSHQARADTAARDERERRDLSVLRALAPVQETLQNMQTKVDELERDRHRQFGAVAEQLRAAHESDQALRSATDSLLGALKSNSTRGVWGETQLRRVVEAAGLTRYVDFDLQSGVVSDSGAGRPDMIIRLPGNKSLAVDAKVPLDAFLEATNISAHASGEEAQRRSTLMTRHVKAVRAHIDALAKKGYWAGLDASPEFVICFLPNESLLASALEADPTLLDYAFSKRVALASPVNLWAVLKTVAYTWTQQEVSDEARTLFDLGNELYQRLGGLAGHADDMRRAIERTVDSYNRFVGTLESRVLVTARKFPGIDETKLDTVPTPAAITASPRRLTASEMLAEADLGDLRDRLAD